MAFAKVREMTSSVRKRQHRVALGLKVKDVSHSGGEQVEKVVIWVTQSVTFWGSRVGI